MWGVVGSFENSAGFTYHFLRRAHPCSFASGAACLTETSNALHLLPDPERRTAFEITIEIFWGA
jgi:hypothetical protein